MMYPEMTIDELLNDPLINIMMRADGISVDKMKSLLQAAAKRISEDS